MTIDPFRARSGEKKGRGGRGKPTRETAAVGLDTASRESSRSVFYASRHCSARSSSPGGASGNLNRAREETTRGSVYVGKRPENFAAGDRRYGG